jgi:hypothetical protein
MRATTGSVPDVASRVESAPAQVVSTDKATHNHSISASDAIDPDCGCVYCLAECDRVAVAGGVPTNQSWWRIQRRFIHNHRLHPLSRICAVCGSVKNPDGNCSLVTCRNHDASLECPACGGAREVPRAITSGRDPAKSICRHPFHGEHLIEEFVAEANPQFFQVVASDGVASESVAETAAALTSAEKAKRVASAIREAGMPISRGYDGFGEPWHVHDGIWNFLEMFNAVDSRVFAMRNTDIPEEFHGSYLRRIAACVNACMGIPTAVLERNGLPFASGADANSNDRSER